MQEFDKGEARYGSNKKRGADIFAGGVSRLSGRRHRVRAARSAASDRLGWALMMSVLVYAGSMQFVGIQLLAQAASPLAADPDDSWR